MIDVKDVAKNMQNSYATNLTAGVEKGLTLPDRAEIILALKDVQKLFFPAFFAAEEARGDLGHFAEATLTAIYFRLKKQVERAYLFTGENAEKGPEEQQKIGHKKGNAPNKNRKNINAKGKPNGVP